MTDGRLPRGRPLALLLALLVATAALTVPEKAAGGGTAVVAPRELSALDCKQGSPAEVEGVRARPVPPTVVGCARLSRGEVLVAADRWSSGTSGRVCFYAPATGQTHVDGPCSALGQPGGAREDAPVAGGSGIQGGPSFEPTVRSSAYVTGQASRGVRGIVVRYAFPPHRSAVEAIVRADLVEVGPALARRLGAPGPFSYFVAMVPPAADTCRGVTMTVRSSRGDRRLPINPGFFFPTLPLPGSRECEGERLGRAFLDAVVSPSLTVPMLLDVGRRLAHEALAPMG